jgi:uncharacterized protein YhdP
LRLPLVVASLSPRSVWHLGFEQVYIHAPRLDIRRAADGRFFVAGLDFSRGSDNEGRAADWFFSQGEFVIEDGTCAWTDELRRRAHAGAAAGQLRRAQRARQHALRLDATPPPEWGSRFTLAGEFRQPLLSTHAGNWQQWSGEMHADFSAVDLSQLRRHANLGFDISQGRGRCAPGPTWPSARWSAAHGGRRAHRRQRHARSAAGAAGAAIGVGAAGRQAPRWRLRSCRPATCSSSPRKGQRWPGGNFTLSWTGAEGRAAGAGRTARRQAGPGRAEPDRQPAAARHRDARRAAGLRAAGAGRTLQANWQGPLGALQKYDVHGRASRLEVMPQARADGKAGTPGVRGAARLRLHAGRRQGAAGDQRGALEFPGVFEEPTLPFDTLERRRAWQVNGADLSASINNLKFANADAQGDGQGSWRTTPTGAVGAARFPGALDLQASISKADGARVWRYLPLGVPQSARDYVRDSVVSGTATGAKFKVKGDLRKFPFVDPRDGEFLVTAQVRDVHFAYVPPHAAARRAGASWPALTQLAGELVFEGNGMQVKGATGRLAGAPRLAVKASAEIADFKQNVVDVRGSSAARWRRRWPSSTTRRSPASSTRRWRAARAAASGRRPAAGAAGARTGALAGAGHRHAGRQRRADHARQPGAGRARGTVLFSEKGFQVVGAQARALGGDLRLEGGTRPAAAGRAGGGATAGAGHRDGGGPCGRRANWVSSRGWRATSAAAPATSWRWASGAASRKCCSPATCRAWHSTCRRRWPRRPTRSLPLRYEQALTRESQARAAGGTGACRTCWRWTGPLGSVSYLRELGGAEPQVLRGAIAVGLAPGESVDAARGRRERQRAAGQLRCRCLAAGAGACRQRGEAAPAARGQFGQTPTPACDGLPAHGDGAAARQVIGQGRTLHNVVVGGSRDDRTWRVNATADELNGYIEYRQPQGTGAGPGPCAWRA